MAVTIIAKADEPSRAQGLNDEIASAPMKRTTPQRKARRRIIGAAEAMKPGFFGVLLFIFIIPNSVFIYIFWKPGAKLLISSNKDKTKLIY